MNIFEITIQPKTNKGWPVAVKHTPSGRSPLYYKGTLNLNTEDNFAELGQYLGQPGKYGRELGKKLFTQEIRFAFDKALSYTQQDTTQKRQILYVFLHLDTFNDDSLQTLRWERLCAPFAVGDDDWESLSIDRRTTFSIYVPTMTERLFPVIGKNDLRSLIMVANPSNGSKYGLADFDVHKTVESVQASLDNIPSDVLAKDIDGAVGLPTLEKLKEHLSSPDKYYTLFHLVCHGKKFVKGETVIYLANDKNETEPIKTSVLIKELKDLPRAPHFTFLCTCESAKSGTEMGGLAQSLAQKLGMPAVLGMTDPVTIYTAQQLASAFYRELREHGYPSLALTEALVELRRKRKDVIVPVLFSRLEGKPIYSQELDRKLTNADIKLGIERIQESDRQLLKERAPILIPEFEQQEKNLGNLAIDFGVLSESDQNLRVDALKELNILCKQVFDISFNALALTGEITDYDSRCPFKGLKPFRAEDQDFFCGRESLIEKLREKQEKYNFLAVLGASGTGKSSVVLAGLIPVWEEQEKGINIIEFTPDNRPLERLQEKLSGLEGESLVVIVDQFEEVFTLCEKTNRENFIAELLKLAEYQKVIITMRADFWGDCAENEELKEVMLKNQELISPMNGEELRKAIQEQAEKVELRFESGVVNLIEKDVESAPGEMPLLQYALEQLWQRRRGKWLLSEEYNKIGFKEAIARTADRFYSGLSETEKEQVKNIFLRLTRLDESLVLDDKPKYTRQRIYLHDLTSSENFQVTDKLVQRLAGEEARLVVTRTESIGSGGNGEQQITVEVAHEALITHWPKLQGWLEENRANLQLRQSIREDDLEWRKHEQESSFLVHSGNRLAGAEALLQEKGFLNESEMAYVNACISKQRDEQKRKARRNAQIIAGTSIFAVISLGFAVWAIISRVEVVKQKEETQKSLVKNLIQSSRNSFLLNNHSIDSLREGLEAYKENQGSEKNNSDIKYRISLALQQVLSLKVKEKNRLFGHTDYITSLAFAKDGRLASGSNDGTIKIWNQEGKELFSLSNDENSTTNLVPYVAKIAFAPDGKTLASISGGSKVGIITIWSLEDRPKKQILTGHNCQVGFGIITLRFTGETLVCANDDGRVSLWTRDSNQSFQEPDTFNIRETPGILEFTPDGQKVAVRTDERKIKILSIRGQELSTLSLGEYPGYGDLEFTPDGKKLAVRTDERTIKILSIEGEELNTLSLEEYRGESDLEFTLDGKKLAVAIGGKVKIFNLESENQELEFTVHNETEGIRLAFAPDGKSLASFHGRESVVRIWSLEDKLISLSHTDKGTLGSVALAPDGKIIVAGSDDGKVILWTREGKQLDILSHPKVEKVVFASKAKPIIFASISSDRGTIKIWSIDENNKVNQVNEFKPFNSQARLNVAAIAPDGRTIATGSNDGKVKLYNLQGDKLASFVNKYLSVTSITFTPNGNLIAVGGSDDIVRFFDREGNSNKLSPFNGHQRTGEKAKNLTSLVFSQDGQIVASGEDKTIIWTRKDRKILRQLNGYNNVSGFAPGDILITPIDQRIEFWSKNAQEKLLNLPTIYPDTDITDRRINEELAIAADGQTLAFMRGNKINLLPLDLDWTVDKSCNFAKNYLENSKDPQIESRYQDLCAKFIK